MPSTSFCVTRSVWISSIVHPPPRMPLQQCIVPRKWDRAWRIRAYLLEVSIRMPRDDRWRWGHVDRSERADDYVAVQPILLRVTPSPLIGRPGRFSIRR